MDELQLLHLGDDLGYESTMGEGGKESFYKQSDMEALVLLFSSLSIAFSSFMVNLSLMYLIKTGNKIEIEKKFTHTEEALSCLAGSSFLVLTIPLMY